MFARFVLILAALALVATAHLVASPSAFACQDVHPKTGDLNADGLTNSLDALSVLTYTAGMTQPADDLWFGGADVDCSGAVTAVDATIILQVDAGLTTIRP